MITIRAATPKDGEGIRKVCYETAPDSLRKKEAALYLMYCDYYYVSENAFTLVAQEEGKTVGYVMCDTDCARYETTFAPYLKRLKKISRMHSIAAKRYMRSLKKHVGYNAHMHIDILPGYQRMGLGHRLMDALLDEAKKREIKGIQLTCGTKNVRGCNFYEKYGFKKLRGKKYYNVYGILTGGGEHCI